MRRAAGASASSRRGSRRDADLIPPGLEGEFVHEPLERRGGMRGRRRHRDTCDRVVRTCPGRCRSRPKPGPSASSKYRRARAAFRLSGLRSSSKSVRSPSPDARACAAARLDATIKTRLGRGSIPEGRESRAEEPGRDQSRSRHRRAAHSAADGAPAPGRDGARVLDAGRSDQVARDPFMPGALEEPFAVEVDRRGRRSGRRRRRRSSGRCRRGSRSGGRRPSSDRRRAHRSSRWRGHGPMRSAAASRRRTGGGRPRGRPRRRRGWSRSSCRR